MPRAHVINLDRRGNFLSASNLQDPKNAKEIIGKKLWAFVVTERERADTRRAFETCYKNGTIESSEAHFAIRDVHGFFRVQFEKIKYSAKGERIAVVAQAHELPEELLRLSRRQRDVFCKYVCGHEYEEISEMLGLTLSTIGKHKRRAWHLLGGDVTAMVRIAIQSGWC